MRDPPPAVDLAVARGQSQPEIRLLAIRHRPVDAVEAVAEADVIAGRDAEIANLVVERLEALEDVLPGSPVRTGADELQRRNDIECDEVGRVRRHDSVEVLGANRRHETVDQLPDRRFIVHAFTLQARCPVGPARR